MKMIIAALAIVAGVTWMGASPAHSAAPAECVPEGSTIVDVDTGNEYTYGVPTTVGFDTCGNPIPDICVDWGDHMSTLWTVQRCEAPAVPEAPAVEAPAVESTSTAPPTLPETGSETLVMAVIAALLLAAGGGALAISYRR